MKRNIIFSLIIGFVIIAISSCSIFGVGTSMSDRIGYFEDDLNGSRSNIIDNIHPDADAYNTLDDYYWTQSPWTDTDDPFSITSISEGSSSVSATFTSDFYSGGTSIYFEMKDEGDFFSGEDWKIMSINVAGGANEL